jgi:Zn-dependent M28 family amino/carboxypeptidase
MAKQCAGLQFDRTIRFCLFGNEENDYSGADSYAAKCKAAGQTIIGDYCADEIAYNQRSKILGLHTNKKKSSLYTGDKALAQTIVDAVGTYGISGVTPTIVSDGNIYSDHSSFWTQGYNALMAVEDFNDYDPYEHTANDVIGNYNWTYYVGVARALEAGAATEAGIH